MISYIKWLVFCGLLAVPLVVGLLWLDHNRETSLPAPTGPFAVGRSLYDWAGDQAAPKRELLAWVWYPAEGGESGTAADGYLPASVRALEAPPGGPLILRPLTWVFRLTIRDRSKVRGHSLGDASVSPRHPSYPVVLLRAGGTSEVMNYSALAEDLAING